MSTQITAPAVGESLDGRPVLDSVTCSLRKGERTGIVGENRPGRTTRPDRLLRRRRGGAHLALRATRVPTAGG
jgi:macrolide transport system ATP-binding/permease protein